MNQRRRNYNYLSFYQNGEIPSPQPFVWKNKAPLQREFTLKYPQREKIPSRFGSSVTLAMGQVVQLESVTLSARVVSC